MLLCSLLKKLYKNEGVDEEVEDIFRSVHKQVKKKVSDTLKSRDEVKNAINVILSDIKNVDASKMTGFFSFLVKSEYNITDN